MLATAQCKLHSANNLEGTIIFIELIEHGAISLATLLKKKLMSKNSNSSFQIFVSIIFLGTGIN